MRTWTPADVAEAVRRTRAAQGLPPKIEDRSVLRRIATLVTAGKKAA